MTTLVELPILQPGSQAYTCSHLCGGACCRYFSLQIDTPRTAEDFDDIRWYLMHEDTHVYKYEGAWYVMSLRRCRHLGENNLCTIYERRPRICAEYDPTDCEFTGEVPYDLYFRDDAELEAWLATQRLARSAASRKAWAKRRRGVRAARARRPVRA